MSLLVDIVATAVDLLRYLFKAQAKSLLISVQEQAKSVECCFKRICVWCGLLAFNILLLLAGIGYAMWGAFKLLASATGPGVAAVIIGAIVSLVAIVLISTAKSSIR